MTPQLFLVLSSFPVTSIACLLVFSLSYPVLNTSDGFLFIIAIHSIFSFVITLLLWEPHHRENQSKHTSLYRPAVRKCFLGIPNTDIAIL